MADYTLRRVGEGVMDVVDWPEPGGCAGRVIKLQHRGHTNRVGWRWFPHQRLADGSFERLESWGWPTAKAAAMSLVARIGAGGGDGGGRGEV